MIISSCGCSRFEIRDWKLSYRRWALGSGRWSEKGKDMVLFLTYGLQPIAYSLFPLITHHALRFWIWDFGLWTDIKLNVNFEILQIMCDYENPTFESHN